MRRHSFEFFWIPNDVHRGNEPIDDLQGDDVLHPVLVEREDAG
jgi:hypothetical protein